MDPYALLGVAPGAGERELARAYRRLAKRWHPDRAGEDGTRRMAELNQAYELARLERRRIVRARRAPARRRRPLPGSWLREPVRRALGRELLSALYSGEDVALVAVAETWASPRTLLVVTDRRLLWLLDDAITGRVRSLRFDAIAEVEDRLRWPLRRAVLRVRSKNGRRHAFAGLRPDTAAQIAIRVRAAVR
ncbi:MAG TPA: J domain-containing protein [Solirubrobacteraceae bacterium]